MLLMFNDYKIRMKILNEEKKEIDLMKNDITNELTNELNKTFVNQSNVDNLVNEYVHVLRRAQRIEKEMNALTMEIKAFVTTNVNNIVLV